MSSSDFRLLASISQCLEDSRVTLKDETEDKSVSPSAGKSDIVSPSSATMLEEQLHTLDDDKNRCYIPELEDAAVLGLVSDVDMQADIDQQSKDLGFYKHIAEDVYVVGLKELVKMNS